MNAQWVSLVADLVLTWHWRAGIQALDDEREELDTDFAEVTQSETANSKQQEVHKRSQFTCPASVPWQRDAPETDLHIATSTMTVLAMDGRRRILEIHKLVRFFILEYSESCHVFIFFPMLLQCLSTGTSTSITANNCNFLGSGKKGWLVHSCDKPGTMCGSSCASVAR